MEPQGLRIGSGIDEQSSHHRRRRHRRAGDRPDAAPDRRALRRVRGRARDAPARRRHQHAAQRGARALRSRHHASRSRPRRPARARNGRWSGSTATTSIPSRAGCSPATTGRNTRCIAAASTCCCTTSWWSAIGRGRGAGSAAASPAIARMPMAASPRRSSTPTARASEANGALLIGADGIHSAVRAQMHPAQPPIHWGGAIMWRGTTWGKPIRTGSSFVGLGTHRQRVVFYPISHPDPKTGLSHDQLDRRGDDGQHRGLEAERLVPAGGDVRLRASFRRLGVGLARRAGPDPAAPTARSRTR